MLNAVVKTVTLASGQLTNVYLRVALTDAQVFLNTVTAKSYTCCRCGRRRTVKSAQPDDIRALLVASKLCFECHTSIVTDLQAPQAAEQTRKQQRLTEMVATEAAKAAVPQFDTHRVKHPETLWRYESRLAFHNVYRFAGKRQVTVVRRRLHPGDATPFNGFEHFGLYETKQLLDVLLADQVCTDGRPVEYGLVTLEADSKDARDHVESWVKDRIRYGLTPDGPETGRRFRVIYFQCVDTGMLLCVSGDSEIKSLRDLGLVLSDDVKGEKRARRAFSQYQLMLECETLRTTTVENGTEYLLRLASGVTFTYLDYDMSRLDKRTKALVEGMCVVNSFGTSVTFTALVGGRMAKGYGRPNSRVRHGVVAYDTKSELVLKGTKAYIGVLGIIGAYRAKSDPQSMINMGMYKPDLVPAEAKAWMAERKGRLFSEREEDVRALLCPFLKQDEEKFGIFAPTPAGQIPIWQTTAVPVLTRALLSDIGIKSLSVLQRRAMRILFEDQMDPKEGRIPMSQFVRPHVAPLPDLFLENGDLDLSRDVLGDNVSIKELPEGWVLIARNPNTTADEAVLAWNARLDDPTLEAHTVYFGAGAWALLAKLNGGDMDDNCWATADPAYIARWKQVHAEFPVTPKAVMPPAAPAAPVNPHVRAQLKNYLALSTGEWSPVVGLQALEKWTQGGMTLGRFINNILCDILQSGENRLSAVAELQAGRFIVPPQFDLEAAMAYAQKTCGMDVSRVTTPETFAEACLMWTEARTGDQEFITREEANNSERVIDFLVMGKGDPHQALEYMRHSMLGVQCPWFPKCYADRIPAERKARRDYVLVETEACRGFQLPLDEYQDILEAGRGSEWLLLRDIPDAAKDYVWGLGLDDATVAESARNLRSLWVRLIGEVREFYTSQHLPLPEDWLDLVINGREVLETVALPDGRVQTQLVKKPGFYHHYFYLEDGTPVPEEYRLAIAAEIFHLMAKQKPSPEKVIGPDGRARTQGPAVGVPDFVLHDLFTVYDRAGLTGQVVLVDLDPRAARRLERNGVAIHVRSEHGSVEDIDNGRVVGECPTLPDGTYEMDVAGFIVVKASHPELQSRFRRADLLATANRVEFFDQVPVGIDAEC